VIAQKGLVAFAAIFVFLLCWTLSSVGTVDYKAVGVVTQAKNPTGEIKSSGWYWKAPWKAVTDYSLLYQTDSYSINVQLTGGANVTVAINPRWRIKDKSAPELYKQFRSFEDVKTSLFEAQLKDSANKVFGNYNPLNSVDPATGLPLKTKEQWAQELLADMRSRKVIDDNIEIDQLTTPTIAPDDKTQEKLNAVIQEYATGKILEQKKINAGKAKEITDLNSKVDPTTRCLEIASQNGSNPGTCALFEKGNNSGIIFNSGGNIK
jgi:hypothetical protein